MRLSEVVAELNTRLDNRLIDLRCLDKVRLLAESVPSTAADCFGFERYLGRDDAKIDFAVGISESGKAWLAADAPWPELKEVFAQAEIQDPGGQVRPWLTFDTSRFEEDIQVPSIYVGLDLDRNGISSVRALATDLNRSSTTSTNAIERCLRSFPISVARVYLGSMRSRQATGVRLSIGNLTCKDVEKYLRGIEWPGDINVVAATLRRLNPHCSYFGVQIDISTNINAQLGIELILDTPSDADRLSTSSLELMQVFVEEQWCSMEESTFLQRWPARTQYVAPLIDRLINARHPRPDARLLHGTLLTALHHFKFVFDNRGFTGIKAYFGVYVNLI